MQPTCPYHSPAPVRSPVLRRWFAPVLLFVVSVPAAAQDSIPQAPRDSATRPTMVIDDSTGVVRPIVPVEYDSLGRPIIKYIQIRRSDIFDSTEAHGFLPKLMNGLHFMTSTSVISREILVKEGEPYDSADVAETARNLRTVGIFRRVQLDSGRAPTRGLVLRVFAQDGWSTQADLRFRSAGSQTDWQVALIEGTWSAPLPGSRSATGIRPTETSWTSSSSSPDCWPARCCWGCATKPGATASGARWPSSDRSFLCVTRPEFRPCSMSGTSGYSSSATVIRRSQRLVPAALRPREGGSRPRRFDASNRGYLRIGFNAQVRRDDYIDLAQRNRRRRA